MIGRRDLVGGWPDLAGDVLVYALSRSVVAVRIRPGGLPEALWTQATPEPLMFLRAAPLPTGDVAVVAKGNVTGAGYLVRVGQCEQLAHAAQGNNPIAILAIGAGLLIRWIEPGGIIATRWFDGSVTRGPIPAPWTGTATGLLDLADDGSAIYMDAARVRQVAGGWTFVKPIERTGVVVGQTDGAVRVCADGQVFTALEAPDGFAEDPHLSVLPGGRILVSAFTSRGASVAIIDPPYPPAELPIAAIARPALVGWFHFGAGADTAPGNCTLQVDADMLVRDRVSGAALAAYAAGTPDGDVDALERAIATAAAAHPTVPVLAYWTAGAQRVRLPRGAALIGVEAYQHVDETLAAFEGRVRAAVARCPAAMLIAQGYTSNPGNTTDLVSLVPVYARITRDCPSVLGILVFSSGARATGYDAHPDVQPAWRALFASVPGLPALPEENDVFKKCEVTVDTFALGPGNQLADGTVLEFHDRENQTGARARVWVEHGSCRMSIDYPGAGPGLKGETGARRPVR